LSFFLWSSIPDEELLTAAEQGKLKNAALMQQQVKRMLKDPRSQALVSNFSGQWLYLRELRNRNPDLLVYPEFDDNLRQAFQRETELLFETVVHEDRNVFDVLNADYTFSMGDWRSTTGSTSMAAISVASPWKQNAQGLLGQGSFDDDVCAKPDFAGNARIMDSRGYSRQSAAIASAERTASSENTTGQGVAHW
jgi:hypothetical protein